MNVASSNWLADPGTGAETLKLPGLKCRPGKHTVSYRYLVAQGNNKEMGVAAGGSTDRVSFKEPEGFDADTVDIWAQTSMVRKPKPFTVYADPSLSLAPPLV